MIRNMVGYVFESIEVIADSGNRNKAGEILWSCKCNCGSTFSARGFDIRRGDYQSCGCRKTSLMSEALSTHGMSYTSEYKIWDGVKQRCENPKSTGWENYGGRGVTMCKEWSESFETFYKDMGDKPFDTASIERVDNSLGYSKDNCIWATKSEQAFNRRKAKGCTSNTKNIYYDKASDKWVARSYDGKVRTYIGRYPTEALAIDALSGGACE